MPLDQSNKQLFVRVSLLALLILTVAGTNYGLWNADIPLGDESVYVSKAFNLSRDGHVATNLYFDTYILIFRHLTKDPIIAHYCMRFIASLFSVVAVFLLLSSLDWVNQFGAFVLALFWNLSFLNTPRIQFGNVNLFAFALACIGIYIRFINCSRIGRLCSIGILISVVLIRVEYVLVLFLVGFHDMLICIKHVRNEGWSKQRKLQVNIAAGVILVAMGTIFVLPGLRNVLGELLSYIDQYLFMGFKQCYTAFVASRDGGFYLEPMTEFDVLMNSRFSGASGFFHAVFLNPVEVGRYFLVNGISNALRLHHVFFHHSILQPIVLSVSNHLGLPHFAQEHSVFWYESLMTFLFLGLGSAWLCYKLFVSRKQVVVRNNEQIMVIMSLAGVSIIPLVLLIPDSRYWIMVIPVFLWGPAALISRCYSPVKNHTTIILALAISFLVVNPVFRSSIFKDAPNRDKDVVLALRKEISSLEKKPLKSLGYWPDPLLTFAVPGRWQGTSNIDVRNGSSYEALVRSKMYDLVILDGTLKRTLQYKMELPFFESFLRDPEAFDYKRILNATKRGGPVYIFRRDITKLRCCPFF